MRFTLLSILIVFLSLPSGNVSDEGWEVVEHCLKTNSDLELSFEGVIFTRDSEGVHAFKADSNTPYFIAFSGDDQALEVGAFSPDGHWFAVPVGKDYYARSSNTQTDYVITEIRVYSTDPLKGVVAQIPWQSESRIPVLRFKPIQWLDNERFLYFEASLFPGLGNPDKWFIVNALTGMKTLSELPFSEYAFVSPDETVGFQLIKDSLRLTEEWRLFNLTTHEVTAIFATEEFDFFNPITWIAEQKAFIGHTGGYTSYDEGYELISNRLSLFDDTGRFIEPIITSKEYIFAGYPLSNDQRYLPISVGHRLYLVDLQNQDVKDICIDRPNVPMVWSPNTHQFVFANENNLQIADLATSLVYKIDYAIGNPIAWSSAHEN
jgi:hypothetical protein